MSVAGGGRTPTLIGLLALLAVGCSPVAQKATASKTEPSRVAAPTTSPTPSPSATPPKAPRPVTLAFAGDINFERASAARLADDPSTVLTAIAPVLRRADVAMVNLETAVTTRGQPAPKAYTFRVPPTAFKALHAAGVDVATMANNHGVDFGEQGLEDSLAAARRYDFPVVGIGMDAKQAYAPYRVTVHGQRIAFIGATQVLDSNLVAAWTATDTHPGLASAYQVKRLAAAVRDARRTADIVVVYLHWGQELNGCPLDRQRTLAHTLIEAGADVIVGSHAHRLLAGGYLDGVYVDYGLGNFAFYHTHDITARTGVLTLTLDGRTVRKARWKPAVVSGGVPYPLHGAAARTARERWRELRGCTTLRAQP